MSKGTQPQLGAPRKRMVMRCMALGALFTVAICVWSYLRGQSSKVWQESGIGYDTAKVEITSQSPSPKNCPSALPPPAMPPVDVNLWASLTPTEIMIVNEWLFEPSRDLNLTAGDHAVLSDNLVFRIEAYRPSKASALAYLSSPSWENLPDRFAKVTIHHGARNDQDGGPVIREYLVGPLDVREDMTIKRLTEIYHREEIPFNARAYTKPAELAPFLASIMTPLAEVTLVRNLLVRFVVSLLISTVYRIYSEGYFLVSQMILWHPQVVVP
ncbi:hypothetical protein PHLCEN_2v389 [Hermanssonia centrifuga]|uniref:Uncharacterized protein n=1 Tax=Hermanssonia centrifuga TaxID=98765 RepID=A0A2R6S671_9APHY|nr:hypothetical protein PHLCEN_2v389 [Hermanssonia centrifuga]